MIYLWMSIIIISCYFIGNINFARIFTWELKRKDITKIGSGNPGMTNVLRTHGFGMAILTMVFEFIKGGVPALIAAIVMNKYYPGMFYVVDLTAGLAAMLGQIFPVIYGFKGGKGVAVFVGVFFFSPLWWIALSLFVLFFIISLFAKYGAHINLPYVFLMSSAVTIYNAVWLRNPPYFWVAIIIVWMMFILEIIMHRKNILRLIHKNENKINLENSLKEFWDKINKKKKLPPSNVEIENKSGDIEKEIVIYETDEIVDEKDDALTMDEVIDNEELFEDEEDF